MRRIRGISSFAVALATIGLAHTASAQQVVVAASPSAEDVGVDRAGGSIAAILGFGAHSGAGFGLGVEGGYTLPMHLYLGGNLTYFTGSDSVTSYIFEGQVGYDLGIIKAAPILIRPYVGIGYQNFTASAFGVSVSAGGAVITPGVVGTYFITPHIFAGADIRLDYSTSSAGGGIFDLFATGGYKF